MNGCGDVKTDNDFWKYVRLASGTSARSVSRRVATPESSGLRRGEEFNAPFHEPWGNNAPLTPTLSPSEGAREKPSEHVWFMVTMRVRQQVGTLHEPRGNNRPGAISLSFSGGEGRVENTPLGKRALRQTALTAVNRPPR